MTIVYAFANSVDPDKMLHYVAFRLGLHRLSTNAFRSFKYKRLKVIIKVDDSSY